MMPLRRFTIHQPQDITEASDMLAHYGEKARLYAGGTELLLAMKHGLLGYEHLVDIKTVPGLTQIELKNSSLVIGCAATHRAIENSALIQENLPVLAKMANRVANVRVRATGTLGGNLCFAEPHSDPAALLMALDARVIVQRNNGQKKILVEELITGAYETSLSPEELVTVVEIPLPSKSTRAAYVKFQTHERPTLGLALVLDLDGDNIKKARAVVGSIGAKPNRSARTDTLLTGPRAQVERLLSEAAANLADAADPVDDLQGSAEYKRHLVGVFLKRAYLQALTS